jgi:signal transduction histidine kinase
VRRRSAGSSLRRLRLALALFFLALAIPTALLVYRAYGQLKWEAFHHAQGLAEELARRIEQEFQRQVEREEARGYGDYEFLVVGGDHSSGFLHPSPLAALPGQSDIPGLLGYFQVDDAGRFSTPLLPQAGVEASAWGVDGAEFERRREVAARLRGILLDNRLVGGGAREKSGPGRSAAPDAAPGVAGKRAGRAAEPAAMPEEIAAGQVSDSSGQALFDKLDAVSGRGESSRSQDNLGRVEDLKLEQRYRQSASPAPAQEREEVYQAGVQKRSARREVAALPEAGDGAAAAPAPPAAVAVTERQIRDAPSTLRIRTFASELDPFEFSRLESGEFVLYRKVWREGKREIQGMLVDARAWLQGMVAPHYRTSALAQTADLLVAFRGDVLTLFGSGAQRGYLSDAGELQGALLYQSRLAAPLGDLVLILSVQRLPAGPGAAVVNWLALILALVLLGGFLLLARLGASQLRLARQQQDFVSAVSHELKTPLTSIRMYAEMLRAGWAPQEKRERYYQFIQDESERLSRLIDNVLQLARLTRNDLQVNARPTGAAQLLGGIRSRVDAQVAAAGFALSVQCEDDAGDSVLQIDQDLFTQIMINLVDNALKFSARAALKRIDIGCSAAREGAIAFTVRDYGPGLPRDQMKKVFTLFYRMENELTRETVGTGIGLSLVRQLAVAMGGRVEVCNREPGAEFTVLFPSGQPQAPD